LHDLASRQALAKETFCQAFAQLGIWESEALEAFAAMDVKGKELVSLAELRIALVCTSRQSLLWELRCRLSAQGITPNDFSKVKKVLEIARRPRHRTVRQRRRQPFGDAWAGLFRAEPIHKSSPEESSMIKVFQEGTATEVSVEELFFDCCPRNELSNASIEIPEKSVGFLPSSSRLSRMDWFAVCAAIGLTLVEAERLFPILGNTKTGNVDLREMFAILRADVSPHVSLERFTTRVLTRYGSLQNAFAAVCKEAAEDSAASAPLQMRWSEFHFLAASLDVEDFNAEGLWSALALAQQASNVGLGAKKETVVAGAETKSTGPDAERNDGKRCARPGTEESITEESCVREHTQWAPRTAVCAQRNQVD
jgi:hypothetical protein